MTGSGIDHTEHRRAVAALNAWDWAEFDDPITYADIVEAGEPTVFIHTFGRVTQDHAAEPHDPAAVRERLAQQVEARRRK